MGLITYKPTTPSYRKTVKIDKSQLFKGRPEKSLIEDYNQILVETILVRLQLDIDPVGTRKNTD